MSSYTHSHMQRAVWAAALPRPPARRCGTRWACRGGEPGAKAAVNRGGGGGGGARAGKGRYGAVLCFRVHHEAATGEGCNASHFLQRLSLLAYLSLSLTRVPRHTPTTPAHTTQGSGRHHASTVPRAGPSLDAES